MVSKQKQKTFPTNGVGKILDVAACLSCSRAMVYKLLDQEKLSETRVGSEKRIYWSSVHEYLEENEE